MLQFQVLKWATETKPRLIVVVHVLRWKPRPPPARLARHCSNHSADRKQENPDLVRSCQVQDQTPGRELFLRLQAVPECGHQVLQAGHQLQSLRSPSLLDHRHPGYQAHGPGRWLLYENGEFERIRPHLTPLECGIIFDGIPEGAISRKVGLIWGIPAKASPPYHESAQT